MTVELYSNLFSWLNLFSNIDEILTYDLLSDAFFLNEIFRNINPNASACYHLPYNHCVMDKVKNWEILLKNIRIYYTEQLQQALVMKLPKILLICHEVNSKNINDEVDKAIFLILGAAVQSERKKYFIDTILTKYQDESTYACLMAFINQVTVDVEVILNCQNISQFSSQDLIKHLRNILGSREDDFQQDCHRLLEEIVELRNHVNEHALLTLEFDNYKNQYTGSHLEEYKSKLRNILNNLDEKNDTVSNESCEHHEKCKFKEVELQLQKKSLLVQQLQTELDSEKESLDYYKIRCQQLRNDWDQVCDENAKLLNKIDNKNNELELLELARTEYEPSKNKITELEKSCCDKNNVISKLEEQLQSLQEKSFCRQLSERRNDDVSQIEGENPSFEMKLHNEYKKHFTKVTEQQDGNEMKLMNPRTPEENESDYIVTMNDVPYDKIFNELQNDNKRFSETIHKLRRKIEKLNRQLNEQKEENMDLNSSINTADNKYMNLEFDLQMSIQECSNLDRSMADLTNINTLVSNHNEDLIKEISSIKEINFLLESKLKLTENSLEELTKDRQQLVSRNLEFDEKMGKLETNYRKLQDNLNSQDVLMSNCKSRIVELEKSLDAPPLSSISKVEIELNKTVSESKENNGELFVKRKPKRRHSETTAEQILTTKMEERNLALQRRVASMTIRDKELANCLSEITEKYQELEEKYSQAKTADSTIIITLHEEIMDLKQNNSQLTSEKTTSESQCLKLKDKLCMLENDLESLRARNNEFSIQNLKLNVEKTKMKTELDKLRNEKKNLESQMSETNKLLATSMNQRSMISKTLNELEYRCNNLQESSCQYSTEYEHVKGELDKQNDNNSNLKYELNGQKTENEYLRSELEVQITQNKSLRSELDLFNAQKTDLISQVDYQLNQNENLKSELERQLMPNKNLKSELERQVTENVSLRSELDIQSSHNTSLTSELKKYVTKYTDMTSQCDIQIAQVTALKTELKRQINDNINLQSQIDQEIIQNHALKSDLERHEFQWKSLKSNFDLVTSDQGILSSKNTALKLNLDRQLDHNRIIQSELDSKCEELKKLKIRSDNAKHEQEFIATDKIHSSDDDVRQITGLRRQNSHIKEEYDILTRKCEETERELQNVLQNNLSLKAALKQNRLELEEARAIKHKIETKSNELEGEMERLAGRIQSIIDQNEDLKIGNNGLLLQMKSMIMQNQDLLTEALQNKQDHYTEENTLRNRINQLEWQKNLLDSKIIENNAMNTSPSRNQSIKARSHEYTNEVNIIKRKHSGIFNEQKQKGTHSHDNSDNDAEHEASTQKKDLNANDIHVTKDVGKLDTVTVPPTKYLVKSNSITLGAQRPQSALESVTRHPIKHSISTTKPSNVSNTIFTYEDYSSQRKEHPLTRLPRKKSISDYDPQVLSRHSIGPISENRRLDQRYIEKRSSGSPARSRDSSVTRPKSALPSDSNNENVFNNSFKSLQQNFQRSNTYDSNTTTLPGKELTRQLSTKKSTVSRNSISTVSSKTSSKSPPSSSTSDKKRHVNTKKMS